MLALLVSREKGEARRGKDSWRSGRGAGKERPLARESEKGAEPRRGRDGGQRGRLQLESGLEGVKRWHMKRREVVPLLPKCFAPGAGMQGVAAPSPFPPLVDVLQGSLSCVQRSSIKSA